MSFIFLSLSSYIEYMAGGYCTVNIYNEINLKNEEWMRSFITFRFFVLGQAMQEGSLNLDLNTGLFNMFKS